MQDPISHPTPEPLVTADGLLVVVGGGTADLDLLAELAGQGAVLVGADGGGDVIAAAGLVPHAIIGDLDSLDDPDGWGPETRVIRLTEQLTTDFEKVLYSTSAPVTIALGMTGRRFDHTLSAISTVTHYARQRAIVLVDEADVALALSGPFAFDSAPGERVSIYPLLPIDFSRSTGLAYPLDGLRLEQGGRIGTSNAADATRVEIVPADATPWLLIVEKSHLPRLIAALRGTT